MADRPKIRVAPLALAGAGLSAGAAEYAGAIAISLGPDVVLAPAPALPPPEVVREAIRPRRAPLLVGPVGAAAALASSPTPRRGSPYLDLATKHGVAAALKAEAPQAGPHWALAAEADARGFTASADHHDRMADRREHQRTARKAANRRRAKRGWR